MNNFKYLGTYISYKKTKKIYIFKKQIKFSKILGIQNNNFTVILVQKSSRIIYMEAKFGPSDKRIEATDINRDENFQKNGRIHIFLTFANE